MRPGAYRVRVEAFDGRPANERAGRTVVDEATAWIGQVGDAWDDRLAALARHLKR